MRIFLPCLFSMLFLVLPSYLQAQVATSRIEVALDLAPLLYAQNQQQSRILIRQDLGSYAWRYGLNFQLLNSGNNLEEEDRLQEIKFQRIDLGLSFGWQRNLGEGPLKTYFGAQLTAQGSLSEGTNVDRRFWENGNFASLRNSNNSGQSLGIALSPLVGFWYQWFDRIRMGAEISPQIMWTYSWLTNMGQQSDFNVLGNIINEEESLRESTTSQLQTTLNRSSLAIWFSCLF